MGLRNCQRGHRVPKALNVRPGGNRDVNLVKDLDLKCYHYPWSSEQWAATAGASPSEWCLATLADRLVGFAIWRQEKDTTSLQRLGVKPDSRNQGVGTGILGHVLRCACTRGVTKLSLVVPEIHCFPGHPDDVSSWLLARGFRAEPPIISKYAYMYGQWSDGFCFVKAVEGEPQ